LAFVPLFGRLQGYILLNSKTAGGVYTSRRYTNAMSACVEALISRAETREGDSEFAARVAESQRRVFQIAYSVLANPADAEEVAQEVFIQAYRKFAMLRDPEKFGAWVSRIAFRLALNRQRMRRRQLARDTAWQAARPDPVADGAREAHDRVFLDRLRSQIDQLPEKLRAVLLLCTVADMDPSTVATVLEIPVGTVRSRLHLARKHLLGALSR
jgi:RNA polymerase sigma-70 factor (ECF subfamily)